jgi:hypothetical protein
MATTTGGTAIEVSVATAAARQKLAVQAAWGAYGRPVCPAGARGSSTLMFEAGNKPLPAR